MYAILAEDESDAEVLTAIIKRFFSNDHLSIRRKGYDGCGGLCGKGARDIRAWTHARTRFFIICHDADSNPPEVVRNKVMKTVVEPAGLKYDYCIVIPVEEIKAWLIADESAINCVIPSFGFEGHGNPETISEPKEWLVRESIRRNGKPLYSPKTFNEKVARHLDLNTVARKCASFRAFTEWLAAHPQ